MADFRIADTFTASLAALSSEQQTAAKTTAFDLQMSPASPGMRFHRLDKAKDKNFWSLRVSDDLRLIVHRGEGNLLLCYVGHHDDAYRWAERRKIEIHPKTGAAQIVELREVVREIEVPRYIAPRVQPAVPAPKLFAGVPVDALLGYGVPNEWVSEVREATEETLFEVAEHLPAEAAEALLELATGGRPKAAARAEVGADPFAHPDAQRRFRVVASSEELERALEYPWERWAVFLHPTQREVVEREAEGPTRVAGSAGTGKTIVALHRAVHLAREHPEARVLLATFTEALASALRVRLHRLIGNEPRIAERLEVQAMGAVGRRLYQASFGAPKLASEAEIRRLLAEAAGEVADLEFGAQFLWSEWTQVVDAWQIDRWEDYRAVQRLGRKTRLGEKQRERLWAVFDRVRERLAKAALLTEPAMLARLAGRLAESGRSPFDFAVVDEAQDLGVPELRWLAALGQGRPDALFFAGDLGQRIFQTPFSWLSVGVDVRGRSHTLRINYRTSQQIRRQADRLLPPQVADVDGNAEDRRDTISVFAGPEPVVRVLDSSAAETEALTGWLQGLRAEGFAPHEIGIFVRTEAELGRALAPVERSGLAASRLDDRSAGATGAVAVGTMHLAKGLEFRAVAVAACDDEILPLQSRIESIADPADLEEVYNTERHLLYVACTRAREQLLVTGVKPASEFLEDLLARHRP